MSAPPVSDEVRKLTANVIEAHQAAAEAERWVATAQAAAGIHVVELRDRLGKTGFRQWQSRLPMPRETYIGDPFSQYHPDT